MGKCWLYNKNVLITGASGGLGFSVAKKLIEKYDCNVLGIARNQAKIESAKQSLGDKKDKFSYLLHDVSTRESWEKIRDELEKIDFKPDVLINNAGFMLPFAKFHKYSDQEIDEIVNTNFLSVVYGTKTLLPLILQSENPAIVNVSSAAGVCAVVGESMYCATKFAVKGFTETLQQDYKKQLYIGGIYPGFIRTDILNRQNGKDKNNKLINMIMMPVNKATKKIVKGIKRRRKRIVISFTGKFMDFFGRLFPKFTPSIIRKVLKISKLDLFEEVFEFKENKK